MNPTFARLNSEKDLSKPDAPWHDANAMQVKIEHPEFTDTQIEEAIAEKWKRYCEDAYFEN